MVSHARPRTCGEIVGLAVARGRAQAGLGSACRTADGPVAAFTYRDQLTLHVESALAQIADLARLRAEVAPQLLGQTHKTRRYPDYPRRGGQAPTLWRELGGDTGDRVPAPVDYQRR